MLVEFNKKAKFDAFNLILNYILDKKHFLGGFLILDIIVKILNLNLCMQSSVQSSV